MEVEDKYLGIKILKPDHNCSSHEFLVEKFNSKLAGWIKHYLSHAGRTVLIQSVLALIPLYYMATALLPKTVLRKLTQSIRNFWWGHAKDQKKMHFLNWSWFNVCKEKGGLGLRSLEHLNKALVAKLGWRFLSEPNSLWCQLLAAKYMRNGCFWSMKKPQKCSSTWAAILDCREHLKYGCIWLVGDGSNINVWYDPWIPSLQATHSRCHQMVRMASARSVISYSREKVNGILN